MHRSHSSRTLKSSNPLRIPSQVMETLKKSTSHPFFQQFRPKPKDAHVSSSIAESQEGRDLIDSVVNSQAPSPTKLSLEQPDMAESDGQEETSAFSPKGEDVPKSPRPKTPITATRVSDPGAVDSPMGENGSQSPEELTRRGMHIPTRTR